MAATFIVIIEDGEPNWGSYALPNFCGWITVAIIGAIFMVVTIILGIVDE